MKKIWLAVASVIILQTGVGLAETETKAYCIPVDNVDAAVFSIIRSEPDPTHEKDYRYIVYMMGSSDPKMFILDQDPVLGWRKWSLDETATNSYVKVKINWFAGKNNAKVSYKISGEAEVVGAKYSCTKGEPQF